MKKILSNNKTLLSFLMIFLTTSILSGNFTNVRATTAPSLLSPSPGSYVNDNTPLFDWTDVTGNDNYNIQITTDITFTVIDSNVLLMGTSPSSYTPSSALAEGLHYWRVRSYDSAAGGWSDPSSEWSLTIDTIAPAAPDVITPEYYGYINYDTPYVEWVRDLGALKYRVEFDDTWDYSSPLDTRNTYNWFYTYPTALADGRYYVRVRSEDYAGNQGPWTEVPFDIDTEAPLAPTLTNPTEGGVITSSTYNFEWDDYSGNYFWYLEFSRVIDFSTTTYSVGTNSPGHYTCTPGYSNGLYYWRVSQKDYAENLSPWSSTGTYTLDTIGPTAPTLVSPESSTYIADTTPYLDWNVGGDAVEYQVMVDTSDSFPSPDVSVITANTYHTTNVLSEGQYYWRVRGNDPYDNWGSWSTIYSFTIDITNPNAPALDSPGDNEKTNDNTTLLEWFDVSETAYFQVQVDTTDTFSSPLIDVSSLAVTYYQISSELSDDSFFWRVRAQDLAGNWGSWSVVRSFEVDTQGPSATVLVSPADTTLITGTTPTILWNAVADGVEYQIQIDNSIDFLSMVYDNLTANTFFSIVSTLMDDTYQWRVRARDDVGNWGTWSEIWSFIVDVNGPVAPNLLSPSNNAFIDDDTPVLEWLAVSDAVEYELQVDTLVFFVTTFLFVTTEDTNYTIFFTLDDGSYYWRVRAKDAAGNWGEWSEIWQFSIDTVKPYISRPGNIEYNEGETGNEIDWIPIDDFPGDYIVYFDSNEIRSGQWNSSEWITINVDGLSVGIYNYTIWISDHSGQTNVDTVIVTVNPQVIPELNIEILFLAVPISIGAVILLIRKQRIFK